MHKKANIIICKFNFSKCFANFRLVSFYSHENYGCSSCSERKFSFVTHMIDDDHKCNYSNIYILRVFEQMNIVELCCVYFIVQYLNNFLTKHKKKLL